MGHVAGRGKSSTWQREGLVTEGGAYGRDGRVAGMGAWQERS